MNVKAKQRIIGGLVLLAVLAIFLPVLFHSSRPSEQLKLSTNIPKQPASPNVQLQLPAASQAATAASTQETVPSSMNTMQAEGQDFAAPADMTPNRNKQAASAIPNTKVKTVNLTKTQAHQSKKPSVKTTATKTRAKHAKTKVMAKAAPKVNKPVAKKITKKTVARKPAVKKANATALTSRSTNPVATSMPKAWVVQIASFSDRSNATRLMKKLRAKGFDTYIRTGALKTGKSVSRVYVGPEIQRVKIKRIQRKLKREFKLNGIIRQYKV